jgi:hypothetical protein
LSSQLAQVVAELDKCHSDYTDGIKMSVLGSRKQGCINEDAKEKTSAPGSKIRFEKKCVISRHII